MRDSIFQLVYTYLFFWTNWKGLKKEYTHTQSDTGTGSGTHTHTHTHKKDEEICQWEKKGASGRAPSLFCDLFCVVGLKSDFPLSDGTGRIRHERTRETQLKRTQRPERKEWKIFFLLFFLFLFLLLLLSYYYYFFFTKIICRPAEPRRGIINPFRTALPYRLDSDWIPVLTLPRQLIQSRLTRVKNDSQPFG